MTKGIQRPQWVDSCMPLQLVIFLDRRPAMLLRQTMIGQERRFDFGLGIGKDVSEETVRFLQLACLCRACSRPPTRL